MIHNYLIDIGGNEYPYFYADNTNSLVGKLVNEFNADLFIVIYDNALELDRVMTIKKLIERKYKCRVWGIDVKESAKNLNTFQNVVESVISSGVTRQSCLIAVGGGVLGNIVGLAASLIFRGIGLIHIPTSIIAAADSVLSLKQAINSAYGKNMIGTFYKPKAVFTDYSLISTLPEREIKAGLAELVKNLLTIIPEDINLFLESIVPVEHINSEWIDQVIKLSIKAKCTVLRNDTFEKSEGLVLEYGHTVGHAIELLSKGRVIHGEAVAFGMLVAAEISRHLGLISDDIVKTHYYLLEKIKIIDSLKQVFSYNVDEIKNVMKFDNKRGYVSNNENEMPFVLLESLGKCNKTNNFYITLVDEETVKMSINKVFEEMKARY